MQLIQNKIFFVTLALIIGGLLYLLGPILTPFLAGALLAYLGDPLVEKLQQYKLPRLVSVIIVFLLLFSFLFLFVLLLIPIIQKQIELFISYIPVIIAKLENTVFPWLRTNFGVEEVLNANTIKTTIAENWTKAGGIANWFFKTALHSGLALLALITNLILIPVVTFYLLRDWHIIIKNVRALLPRHIEPVLVKLGRECNATLSAFFRGQLLVMFCLGIIYSIGLTLIGLQLGLMIGLIAGLVSIVPYLGFIIGIVTASVAAFVQFGTYEAVFLVWIVFAIGQSLESMVLTPKLVGDRIGLHPVAVIFAILAGGMLFGFFGVLLALPAAAVIMVWLRYLTQRYRASHLYK